jgi:hypothetical protein
MAGEQTHGFDFVLEIRPGGLGKILQAILDGNNLLSNILNDNGGDRPDGFTVDISYDRPTDVGLAPGEIDVIDVTILLGPGGTGSEGTIRIVVGTGVVATGTKKQGVIDFQNRLFFVLATLPNEPARSTVLTNRLKTALPSRLGQINLPGATADTTETDVGKRRDVDVRIIDDTSAADLDALGYLFTMGGGSPGDRNAFSQSFIADDLQVGLGLNFGWLCRKLSPAIDQKLGTGGHFQNCELTQPTTITVTNKDGEKKEVHLTRLRISLVDGGLGVDVGVEDSGFCWSATADVSATLTLTVDSSGTLTAKVDVGNPNVDTDVPWYCYLAAAVLGALTGGLIDVVFALGSVVVAAVIGGVVAPLLLWLTVGQIEGSVNDGLDAAADAINSTDITKDLPVDLKFDRVVVDDITLHGSIRVLPYAPLHAAGTVVIKDGQRLDLDTGAVGDPTLPSADLEWSRSAGATVHTGVGNFVVGGRNASLRAVCGAQLGRTGRTDFDNILRCDLYDSTYSAPNPVSLEELAAVTVFGWMFGDAYRETLLVYGVRTNEGRWAAVQVVEVTDTSIRVRYETFAEAEPSVTITGGFDCRPTGRRIVEGSLVFTPSDLFRVRADLLQSAAAATALGLTQATSQLATVKLGGDVIHTQPAAVSQSPASARLAAASATPIVNRLQNIPLRQRRIGDWSRVITIQTEPDGNFRVMVENVGRPYDVRWTVNGTGLTGANGAVHVGSVTVHYTVKGDILELTSNGTHDFEIDLAVVVLGNDGRVARTSRCLWFRTSCTHTVREVPVFSTYLSTYQTFMGSGLAAGAPPSAIK